MHKRARARLPILGHAPVCRLMASELQCIASAEQLYPNSISSYDCSCWLYFSFPPMYLAIALKKVQLLSHAGFYNARVFEYSLQRTMLDPGICSLFPLSKVGDIGKAKARLESSSRFVSIASKMMHA